ncbi:basic phospholipase A2 homolog APC-K49-like isoform 2-T3 [Anomaloglossus baeobatrachus]|uniref:basic phospholipase A2 homolog APC-K49-like isoform X2 n=1 Tax=Anomaloglossus baeobatrachus TaxID=238106 RepID=UPI003F506F38
MIPCKASAYVIILQRKTFQMMIQETLNKEIRNSLPYGCSCTTPRNEKIANRIDRCCSLRNCCHKAIKSGNCNGDSMRYSYSYSNGTITCVNKKFVTDCAAKSCECDRKTAMCLMSEEFPEEYAKYIKDESCVLRSQARCFAYHRLLKSAFHTYNVSSEDFP